MLAGDVMALEDVIHELDGLLEQVDGLGMGDGDADKGRHVLAQPLGIDCGVIAHDNAAVFKLFDPLDN